MDKAKKTKLKRIIAAVCAVTVVAVLAAMPLIAKNEAEKDGPQASILSGTVQMGSIDTELIGGGQLAEEDAMTVKIPASVKLTRFLVSNGQTVTEGEAIAADELGVNAAHLNCAGEDAGPRAILFGFILGDEGHGRQYRHH